MPTYRLKEDSDLQKRIEELEATADRLGLRIFSYNHILIEDTRTRNAFWSAGSPNDGAQSFDSFPRNFDEPFYMVKED